MIQSALMRRGFVWGVALALAACGGSGGGNATGDSGASGTGGGAGTTGSGGGAGMGGPGGGGTDAGASGSAGASAGTDGGSEASAGAAGNGGAGGFAHPGILVSQGMLDFVKQKVASGAQPWAGALTKVKANGLASKTYTPHPIATVECGSYSNPDIGCTDEKKDSEAAYTQALLWYYTGDTAYRDKAIEIMNAWSSTVQAHTNSNAPLQSAWVAEVFPRAAEIIRYTSNAWSQSDEQQFADMLTNVYLPEVENGSAANGNWELSMIEATMNIGIFTDDQPIFDKAVKMWRARTPAYLYLKSDGATPVPPPTGSKTGSALTKYWYNQTTLVDGLCQETCRDLGHVQYGLAAMINAAETARIQGVDLYAEEQTRITAGLELHAKYLNGAAVPSWLCGGSLNAVTPDPMWEIAYNAYGTTLGLSLPETQKLVATVRPTGQTHHMDWETLTHADINGVGLP